MNVPADAMLDQSYFLCEGEKVISAGLEVDASV